jgi:hypothetical protein
MTQVSADMMGMLMEESILYMQSKLELIGFDDGDSAVMGMIFAANGNMSIKQSTAKLGYEATMESCKAEMKQIHMRNTFKPKHRHELTKSQLSKMVESFLFLKEKRDGKLKSRTVLGGNTQRDYISKDEASSPTAFTEAVIITAIIDAKEKRDVGTIDVPNAFCQTVIPDEDAKHRIIVRL